MSTIISLTFDLFTVECFMARQLRSLQVSQSSAGRVQSDNRKYWRMKAATSGMAVASLRAPSADVHVHAVAAL